MIGSASKIVFWPFNFHQICLIPRLKKKTKKTSYLGKQNHKVTTVSHGHSRRHRPESELFIPQRPEQCCSTFTNSEKSIYDGKLFAAECCLSTLHCILWGQFTLTCIWYTIAESRAEGSVCTHHPWAKQLNSLFTSWCVTLCSYSSEVPKYSWDHPWKPKGLLFH